MKRSPTHSPAAGVVTNSATAARLRCIKVNDALDVLTAGAESPYAATVSALPRDKRAIVG